MEHESRTVTIDGGFIEVGTVKHAGHTYDALGAIVDGNRLFAYVSSPATPNLRHSAAFWSITTWNGETLALALRVVSSRRAPLTSWFTDRWYYVRFVYDGSVWSGITAGPGCYVKARRTKLASVYA